MTADVGSAGAMGLKRGPKTFMAAERKILEPECQRPLGKKSAEQLGDRGLAAIVASDDERGPLLQPDRDVPQKPEILDLHVLNSHAFPPLIHPMHVEAIVARPTTSF